MNRFLLTAFAPFGHWEENSSWLALQTLTRELPDDILLTTRRYPVDYPAARQQLENDLDDQFDFALFMGQSARADRIELETVALNVAEFLIDGRRRHQRLCSDGPVAYQTGLPVEQLADVVNDEGIPCGVSYHAGTYLCNALFYWSQYVAEQQGIGTRSLFIHLPLAPEQIADAQGQEVGIPLTSDLAARAVRLIMQQLTESHRMA